MNSKPGQTALDWLLETGDPGVRYLALRDLAGAGGKELQTARKLAHETGPIAQVLAAMDPEGFWLQPGAGYYPKYDGTVWSIILLSQLGADPAADKRIAAACNYVLDHALTGAGQFTINGLASGTVDCMHGNLCAALLDLGCQDPRLDKAFDWLARTVTGEGIAPMGDKKAPLRFYSGKIGPDFACGANNKLPCAWGGTKVMLAFGKLPRQQRTPLIDRAIQRGTDFFFRVDPTTADYPNGWAAKPSGNWWKFGFPVFYVTDLLQIAEAMTGLGYVADPRLAKTLGIIREKQDAAGRWALEYDYAGKILPDFGRKKQPNKWVTLRALRVLRAAEH